MVSSKAAVDTNTIHIPVRPGTDLHTAAAQLQLFGELALLEPAAERKGALSATFFDARAAAAACEALGSVWQCWPAESRGSRSVVLDGRAELEADELQTVSGIREASKETGAYVVEFYDLRDAWRASKARGRQAELDTDTGSSGSKDLHPMRADVRVRGLPSELCTRSCLSAIFEQAGLANAVVAFMAQSGARCGDALVTLVGDPFAVEHLLRHFRGCQWSRSGEPVAAHVLRVYSADASRFGLLRPTVPSMAQAQTCKMVAEQPPAVGEPSEADVATKCRECATAVAGGAVASTQGHHGRTALGRAKTRESPLAVAAKRVPRPPPGLPQHAQQRSQQQLQKQRPWRKSSDSAKEALTENSTEAGASDAEWEQEEQERVVDGSMAITWH